MYLVKFSIVNLLAMFLISCSDTAEKSQLFDIQIEGNKSEFRQGEPIKVSLQNKKEKTIDHITYSIDGKELSATDSGLLLDISKLGEKSLKALVSYEGQSVELVKKIQILASTAPEIYTYEIINEYPHDIKAYTQGLEFYRDTLYESTGVKGKSSLRKVDFTTGTVLKKIDLENTYFGKALLFLTIRFISLPGKVA